MKPKKELGVGSSVHTIVVLPPPHTGDLGNNRSYVICCYVIQGFSQQSSVYTLHNRFACSFFLLSGLISRQTFLWRLRFAMMVWINILFVHFLNSLFSLFISTVDACHLLGRLLSLMGSRWEAAAAVCLIRALDRFHMYVYVVAHAFRLVNYITCKQCAYT